ncbi:MULTISPECIES: MFS transporter [Streptococcus]|uniref:Transporter, major facilitator domain protein n=1 Tax=Streptococcus ictaluri 707-05 TaxID=764299 RepID=G5JZP5_9STRE|nr:MFS transporter [Streptococcus ictaluri]EHI70816.1 transporter, major facilitator domain protein [Streptococcus ictaluri 707-05]
MTSSLEEISILSLSLVLVSVFAITPISHDMYDYYSLPLSVIEILVSLPSLTIMLVLIISPLLTKILSEQTIITTGLIITALSGAFPVLIQSYPLVFASRVLLGIGIGLVNIKAISLIGERYDGEVRQRLFGYRGGVEVFGSAFLTFLAGQLADFDWSYSFLVYSCALIILLLYVFLFPVPLILATTLMLLQRSQLKKALK